MAELVFFSGTMDCGKSTLALQMDHNNRQRGRQGLIFTKLDRAGESVLSSRLGLAVPSIEVTDEVDFWDLAVDCLTRGSRVDYLICDEAQFYTPAQVEQLARLVDGYRRARLRDYRRLPDSTLPGKPSTDRVGRPGPSPPSRSPVLVWCSGDAQCARRRRRDGHRG